ncbi:MAG: hypothetical protein HWE15_06790 [Algoriphagus sp.]|uniref:hypothetical protein n=1 Tax=Algoriphagus sp. TaxID=1872435 RepID=UPI00180C8A50|nr:hypothetical protein [Algoriphagus sp.]NVJ85993.1 hypothetical protein [Algoriphagus sp.]
MNQSIFHGIFGLLLHTGYWLIWLAYIQKGSWMELEKLVPLLVLILLVEFFLGSFQYALPGTHILNQYASGVENNTIVGDAIRVSGTFSYLGGYQVLVPVFACLAWFLILRKSSANLIFSVMILGLLMAFMSGSRGAVGFFILYLLTAFLLTGYFGGKLIKLAIQGTLIMSVLLYFLPSFSALLTRSYENFIYRVENSDELDQRIAGGLAEIIHFKGNYPVFGVGLGATYQGANALFGTSRFVQEYGGYESEPARIVLEGGFVLYFLNFIMIIIFLKYTENLPRLAKFFFLVVYYNSMVTFNVYQGVFYVFGIMLVDRGYYLKKMDKEGKKSQILIST